MLIDLTQEFVDKMMVYPGDEEPQLIQCNFIEKNKYNSFRIIAGLHAGTHIDGPMHMTTSTKFLSDFDINDFYGKACVIDATATKILTWKDEFASVVEDKKIVLVYTGHSKYFGTQEYLDNYPVVDTSFAEKMVEYGIKLLGVDSLSPDLFPFEVHKILLGNNILIAENLTNLDKLLGIENFNVIAFPLKFKSDGAMARIAAQIF